MRPFRRPDDCSNGKDPLALHLSQCSSNRFLPEIGRRRRSGASRRVRRRRRPVEGASCSPAMPSIWKKAKLGGLARLVSDLRISKRGCSDLPLQTGFPTSLADLVVKHRDRLKRSGRRRPKDCKAAAESGVDSSVRSEVDCSSPSYEQSAPSSSPSTAVGEVVGVEIAGGGGFELRRDSPPVQDSSFSGEQGVCASEGVELVVEKTFSVWSAVFLISVFAFGTKAVAFLATALVLALLVVRFLKSRIRLLLSRRDELDRRTADDTRARRSIDAKKKEIRESTDEIIVIESTIKVPAQGRRRSGVVQIEELAMRKEGPSRPKARWWKKLGSRRSGIPDCGKTSMIPPQPSLHLASEFTGETAEIMETKEEKEDEEEIESESETQLVLDKASAHVAMDTFFQGKKSYVGSVIFILLALSGLVGGRIMALILTVVCCLVTKVCRNIAQKCLQ